MARLGIIMIINLGMGLIIGIDMDIDMRVVIVEGGIGVIGTEVAAAVIRLIEPLLVGNAWAENPPLPIFIPRYYLLNCCVCIWVLSLVFFSYHHFLPNSFYVPCNLTDDPKNKAPLFDVS